MSRHKNQKRGRAVLPRRPEIDKETGLPRAYLARAKLAFAATDSAAAEPLPGPLLPAFLHAPSEVKGLKVRELKHYDIVMLRQVESPLLKQLTSGAASKTAYTDEDAYEMIFQFTRPIRAVQAELLKGRKHFRQHSIEQVGMALDALDVPLLVMAVQKEFVRYFSTAIKYAAKSGEGGGEVFTPPPAEPKTASAGG